MMKRKLDNLRFRKLLFYYPAKAMDVLYAEYHQYLVNFATCLTQDPDAAEDIVQETLMLVWENYKKLGQPHKLHIQSYLLAVVRLKSITFYRQRLRIMNVEFDPEAWPDTTITIDEQMMMVEMQKAIREVIALFPRAERECLALRLEGELGNQEIAEQLKVTVKAVERSVTSGYKRFKENWNYGGA